MVYLVKKIIFKGIQTTNLSSWNQEVTQSDLSVPKTQMKALDGLKDQRNQGPKAGAGSKSLEPALISQKYGVSGLTTNLI